MNKLLVPSFVDYGVIDESKVYAEVVYLSQKDHRNNDNRLKLDILDIVFNQSKDQILVIKYRFRPKTEIESKIITNTKCFKHLDIGVCYLMFDDMDGERADISSDSILSIHLLDLNVGTF